MNSNPIELPDNARGGGDDAGVGRALTRVASGRFLETGETTQNQESKASASPEQAVQGERAESSTRESTFSGNGHLGVRLLRVAVLAVCYFLLEIVVKAVTVLQFIFVAWKKRPHAGMQRLGEMISKYMASLWLYCTFASDDAPWPFGPWPRGAAEPQG
jgi:hypothetical protein